MLNVVLFGAGGIGQRYIEGLTALDIEMDLYVVDTNMGVHERVREIVSGSERRIKLYLFESENSSIFPNLIDIVVISTSSLVRGGIVKNILNSYRVKYMVLEKFLFPCANTYKEIEGLIKNNLINVVVNTWMHLSEPLVWFIKKNMTVQNDIIVEGDGFGLGCNAVHFISLFDHMFEGELALEGAHIYEVYESKRLGYYEIDGEMVIRKGNRMIKIISNNRPASGRIKFKIGEESATISRGEINMVNSHCAQNSANLPMISQIFHDEIKRTINNENPRLTPYGHSMRHHLIVFDAFSEELSKKYSEAGFREDYMLFT